MTATLKITLAAVILAISLLYGGLYGAFLWDELFPGMPRYDVFDDSEAILDVMTRTPYGREEQKTTNYYTLASGRRIRETSPFEPDPMTVYSALGLDMVLYQHREVEEFLSFVTVWDENGNSVPLTEDFRAILKQLAESDHSVMTARIMDVGGRLFVYAERNVNLWTPCVLYQYDPAAQTLTELYTWDNMEPVALRLRLTNDGRQDAGGLLTKSLRKEES